MTFEDTLQALLLSYETEGGINHLDGSNLPSEASINRLAADVMHLLFPGFFETAPLTRDEVPALTRRRLVSVHERLRFEIEKSLRFAAAPRSTSQSMIDNTSGTPPAPAAGTPPATAGTSPSAGTAPTADPVARAHEIADAVLARLPELRRIVQTDVQAAYAGDPATRHVEEIILAYPCVLVISLQRFAHELYRLGVPLLPRMITEYAHERTGTDIHPGARIGEYFFIDHCTGVVIGETATLGHHVKIYQGVTLGAKSFEVDSDGNPVKGVKRHPDVADHVTIYAHATILGGDTRIGAHSIVGANVWLLESIPDNSIAYYKNENLVVRSRKKKEAAVECRKQDELQAWNWSI